MTDRVDDILDVHRCKDCRDFLTLWPDPFCPACFSSWYEERYPGVLAAMRRS